MDSGGDDYAEPGDRVAARCPGNDLAGLSGIRSAFAGRGVLGHAGKSAIAELLAECVNEPGNELAPGIHGGTGECNVSRESKFL